MGDAVDIESIRASKELRGGALTKKLWRLCKCLKAGLDKRWSRDAMLAILLGSGAETF